MHVPNQFGLEIFGLTSKKVELEILQSFYKIHKLLLSLLIDFEMKLVFI